MATVGLAIDLWSKNWAFHTLGQHGRRVLIPRVLELQTMLNPGALFGIGSGRTTLFLLASLFALGLVVWMFAQSSPRRWFLQIALGAILAGALGNMYDRLTVRLILDRSRGLYLVPLERDAAGRYVLAEYPPEPHGVRVVSDELPPRAGYVRDFIKIPTKIFGKQDLWPWVFNVADMLLVGGVGVLALYLWRDRRPDRQTAAAAVDLPGPSS